MIGLDVYLDRTINERKRVMPVIISKDPNVVNNGFDKLPTSKKRNGYLYTLVKRSKKAVIYRMTNDKFPEDKSVSFEVSIIRKAPAYKLLQKTNGNYYHYPESERFPCNEDFGKTAWTYDKEESAMKKFDELN